MTSKQLPSSLLQSKNSVKWNMILQFEDGKLFYLHCSVKFKRKMCCINRKRDQSGGDNLIKVGQNWLASSFICDVLCDAESSILHLFVKNKSTYFITIHLIEVYINFCSTNVHIYAGLIGTISERPIAECLSVNVGIRIKNIIYAFIQVLSRC